MRLQKLISSTLSFAMVLSLVGVGASTAYAGRLQGAQVNMSVVRSGTGSNHTISFRPTNSASINKVVFQYRSSASATTKVPVNLGLGGATKGVVIAKNATDTANWSLDLADIANGNLTFNASTATGALSGELFSYEIQGITNNTTTTSDAVNMPLCDLITDSDTCWVRITTYFDATPIDTSTTTYTVINPITMTATVDPILTFQISAVPAGSQPDTNMAQVTDAASDPVTLPFGNLQLGTARVVAQRLNVLTNANSGYTVYNKFIGRQANGQEGGTELMTGTYSGNNIDPFPAGTGSGWLTDGGGTSKVWETPTGTTSNVDTGWLGMRTNNGGLNVGSNFSVSNTWAPPFVGTGNGRVVMYSDKPDNGNVGTIVSFKMQANAFQPADLYTGVTVYNVVASY